MPDATRTPSFKPLSKILFPMASRPALDLPLCVVLLLGCVPAIARADSELWMINADGTKCHRLAETPGFRCGSPAWSPDGKWIAYDTWKIGGGHSDSHIALMRVDGTEQRILGSGAMPSWSPDGTQVTFHGVDQASGIYVANVNGKGRKRIIDHWGSPRWMPQGNRIASIGAEGGIALFDLALGVETPILDQPYPIRQGFGVSPDGLRFCFADMSGGVAVAQLDKQTMKATVRWLMKDGQGYHASWAPDSRRVVFAWTASDQEPDQLYIADVDSDEEPERMLGQHSRFTNTNPAWSPDGKSIVFCRQPPPDGGRDELAQ